MNPGILQYSCITERKSRNKKKYAKGFEGDPGIRDLSEEETLADV